MPTLRNKVNKRKSDSFVVDNAKTRKIATITETKGNVQVPLTVQFKSLKVAHEALIKGDRRLKATGCFACARKILSERI